MIASPAIQSCPWGWLPRNFARTSWTLVKRVGRGTDAHAEEEFCRLYWHPLYAFLRRKGWPEEEARDHVQTFLSELMGKGWLACVEESRGRMRCWLLTVLLRHVARQRARASAERRGHGVRHVPFDEVTAEEMYRAGAALTATPEETSRRVLAVRMVREAFAILRRKYEASGRAELLEDLLPALEGPLVDSGYREIARRHGMGEGAVRIAVVRMRDRFREALYEVAGTALGLPRGPALDAELREIFG